MSDIVRQPLSFRDIEQLLEDNSRMKAEIERLTAALRKIADSDLASPVMYGTEMREIARATLEGKT